MFSLMMSFLAVGLANPTAFCFCGCCSHDDVAAVSARKPSTLPGLMITAAVVPMIADLAVKGVDKCTDTGKKSTRFRLLCTHC